MYETKLQYELINQKNIKGCLSMSFNSKEFGIIFCLVLGTLYVVGGIKNWNMPLKLCKETIGSLAHRILSILVGLTFIGMGIFLIFCN